MSLADLEKYKFQLAQIEASLQLEPDNAELQGLAQTMRQVRQSGGGCQPRACA